MSIDYRNIEELEKATGYKVIKWERTTFKRYDAAPEDDAIIITFSNEKYLAQDISTDQTISISSLERLAANSIEEYYAEQYRKQQERLGG